MCKNRKMLREVFRNDTTWLTLDRPERLNSFTGIDYRDLHEAIERASSNTTTRVIVLTGNGRAFSAGADRTLIDGSSTGDDLKLAGDEFRAMIEALDQCEKPLLAAVNGLAVGFGCTILLHCDFVLMAHSARARLPFTALGIVPEAASSALLPLRARWSDALWAMLSSEWIDAPSAVEMGLAWRVVPDTELIEATERISAILAAQDPESMAATKRLLVAGRADVVSAAMRRENAEMQRLRRKGTNEGNAGSA
jgi:enoyl-CoA hydratase/carnithine racemase